MDVGDIENPELCEEEHSLRTDLAKSEEELARLQSELSDADRELEGLAARSREFEALGDVCRSIEELGNVGAMHLFWEDRLGDPEEQIEKARARIHDYGESLIQAERQRRTIADKIGVQNLTMDSIHYSLSEVMEREEARKNEWLVERDEVQVPLQVRAMPWARGYEEDQRFKKSLGISMAASIMVAILLSSIALPIVERNPVLDVPERVAKLVRQDLPPPPPFKQKAKEYPSKMKSDSENVETVVQPPVHHDPQQQRDPARCVG